jgi:HCOMODA/2-hydroxy-3-carboxy-muconic semialdehyde decarboxylase
MKPLYDGVSRRDFLRTSSMVAVGTVFGSIPLLGRQTPTSAGPADPALIEDLIAANRILYMEGIVDGYGHVSVRHNRNANRFLLSCSRAPELVTGEDLVEYDLDAVPVNLGNREQYSERYIHAEIYKARPDVQSVVHNHSPAVVPFGVSSVPMRPVYHMAGFLAAPLPIFDIRKVAGMTEMLVRDQARGRALAQALGNNPAVLMRGHGVAVVGPDIKFAVGRSIYLEMNARVQLQAMQLGGPVTYLDPEEAKAVMAAGENRRYERPWEMWKRKAMGR